MSTDQRFKSKLEKEFGPLSFALFMRVSRNSLGLTQSEFATRLGLTRGNICDIEKGRQLVSTQLALKVARKAGLPEKLALQACLQDQVKKAGSGARVKVS